MLYLFWKVLTCWPPIHLKIHEPAYGGHAIGKRTLNLIIQWLKRSPIGKVNERTLVRYWNRSARGEEIFVPSRGVRYFIPPLPTVKVRYILSTIEKYSQRWWEEFWFRSLKFKKKCICGGINLFSSPIMRQKFYFLTFQSNKNCPLQCFGFIIQERDHF